MIPPPPLPPNREEKAGGGAGEENKTQSVIHRKRFKEKVKGWRGGGVEGAMAARLLKH